MKFKLRDIFLFFSGTAAFMAGGHSVAFEENFNGDYSVNFPTVLELDNLPPLNNVRPIFTDQNGVAQPWWKVKDSSASEDAFLASHSAYLTPSQSNDWVISRPIEIPTEGYVLTFGAQSYVMRTGDRLSDLRVYISETPVSADNLPSEPTMLIEKVPEGKFPEDIEKDFTEYSLPLNQWAGKTVWLAFSNLNTDKDILVIDNVLIRRLDIAEISVSCPEYAEAGDYTVSGDILASTDVDVNNWTLTFSTGNGSEPQIKSGTILKAGESVQFDFSSVAEADKTALWKLELVADGLQPIVAEGKVTGLGFIPFHRVLLEESTGTWCGNCPIGMYAIEKMVEDEEMGKYVVPVSIHIPGSGRPDYMENENYSRMFAVTSAPALRIDRSTKVLYFSTEHDVVPANPENPLSMAHAVRERHREISFLDIKGDASLIVNGNDTTAVKAHIELTPALTLPAKRYGIGFILTENNVGLDRNVFWRQENYTSGVQMATNLDGLTEMPDQLPNWRFQDVAREVYGYRGYEDLTFPEEFKINDKYQFEVTLPIPDTYKEIEGTNGNMMMVAPAVTAANLTLVAYILDKDDDNRVVNCVAVPLTEQAENRLTIAQQYEAWKNLSGSGTISVEESETSPVYYNLSGIRVDHLSEGIYIMKRGNDVRKVIIRN